MWYISNYIPSKHFTNPLWKNLFVVFVASNYEGLVELTKLVELTNIFKSTHENEHSLAGITELDIVRAILI